MQNERKVLISALLKAEKNGYSNLILDNILNESDLSTLGRGFVTSAFYGILERKMTLDYVLNSFLKRPIDKAPPYTAAVLRSGAYQILFMDKIPDTAAVNESVKLIKRSKESGNSGLVNAVLRNITKFDIDKLNGCSADVVYSVSPWIYNELVSAYGLESTKAFFLNAFETPPIFIRINSTLEGAYDSFLKEAKAVGADIKTTDIADCYQVFGLGSVEKLDSYKKGLFFVQDYSSQLCAMALGAKPNERILDCCAAPGGKSFSISLDMKQSGELISCDIYDKRVGLIKQGADRLGLSNIHPTIMDATEFQPSLGLFDRVLCDAPCSGIGVIRRKPEIKYKSQNECAELIPIQKQILQNVSKYVKIGGRLVYSTCTLLPQENQMIVSEFLKHNSNFSPVFEEEKPVLKTLIPPNNLGDGFFFAVMERKC